MGMVTMNKETLKDKIKDGETQLKALVEVVKKQTHNMQLREQISDLHRNLKKWAEQLKAAAPAFILFLLVQLNVARKAIGAEDEPIVGAQDLKTLFDTVMNLPKLGTTGIILFLVAVAVAFGAWWWWNNYTKKITKRENDTRRTEDQATNRTDNQDTTNEWDEATERVEDIREGLDNNQPKKPRPDPPDKA